MMATTITETSLLNKLISAIQKVKFLMSFNATGWVVSSFSGPFTPHFDVQPSLLDCTIDLTPDDFYECISVSTSVSPMVSPTASNASQVTRTTSNASSSDDTDKRAEIFIAYKHIQMERQISLQLRYRREEFFERTESI